MPDATTKKPANESPASRFERTVELTLSAADHFDRRRAEIKARPENRLAIRAGSHDRRIRRVLEDADRRHGVVVTFERQQLTSIRFIRIIRNHALRNAMLPMVTLIALTLGFTVAGAIQVEAVFSWPGLGALTVNAVSDRDYPVLQGAFLLLAVAVIFANLGAELVYGWLDPRVVED